MSAYGPFRNDEPESFYERDNSRQINDCKLALGKMPLFIEEAIANADPSKLIAHYLCGADVRPKLTEMINQWADHCIAHALKADKGPANIGDSLQALEDSYS